MQGAARAVISAPGYVRIDAPETEAAGFYSTKAEYAGRAKAMLAHYAKHRAGYADLAAQDQIPSTILYSMPDYQALHLIDLSQAIAALRALEAQRGEAFAQSYTLDANDLLPLLLGKTPVRGVTISFDPSRGYPPSEHAEMLKALREVDVVLAPHCPETPARQAILKTAMPALEGRQVIALSPCWDAYVK
jgi:hypothetical protein